MSLKPVPTKNESSEPKPTTRALSSGCFWWSISPTTAPTKGPATMPRGPKNKPTSTPTVAPVMPAFEPPNTLLK